MTHDRTRLPHDLKNGHRSRQPQGPKNWIQQPIQNIEIRHCTVWIFKLVEIYNIHFK